MTSRTLPAICCQSAMVVEDDQSARYLADLVPPLGTGYGGLPTAGGKLLHGRGDAPDHADEIALQDRQAQERRHDPGAQQDDRDRSNPSVERLQSGGIGLHPRGQVTLDPFRGHRQLFAAGDHVLQQSKVVAAGAVDVDRPAQRLQFIVEAVDLEPQPFEPPGQCRVMLLRKLLCRTQFRVRLRQTRTGLRKVARLSASGVLSRVEPRSHDAGIEARGRRAPQG